MHKVKLADILTESAVPSITTDPDKRIRVKLNCGGVEKRPLINESGTTKYYTRKAKQFIYGRQNLFKGAFGIIPDELDGYESSTDLPTFDISNECIPEWILYFLKAGERYKHLETLSKWSGSKRIHPKDFFEVLIPLPALKEQKLILDKIHGIEQSYEKNLYELQTQSTLISKLRSSILNDAVSGRLVSQDSTDEPASMLLERIKAEKERLIKEGKLKRDKPLSPITVDEIPYELPEGWVWCRFGDSGLLQRGKSKHRPRNDSKLFYAGTFPLVQTGDVANAKNYQFTIKTCTSYYNEIGLEQSRLWPKGTLCITIAANIADIGFLNFDACFPDSIVGFQTLLDYVITEYVSLFLINAKSDLIKYAPATAQKNINLGILNELLFPLPPLAEQQRIVTKVENLMATCDALEAEVAKSRMETDRLMQTILQEAFDR